MRNHAVLIFADLNEPALPQPVVAAGEIVPVQHAAVIVGPEHFHGFLADFLLPEIALGHFRSVHEERERAIGFHRGILDLKIDRHDFLKLGSRPTAGAERLIAADHHEPRAHLLNIANEHHHLLIG